MQVISLLGFLIAHGACANSFRGTFVPPETTPILVEGDIAVPEGHVGRGSAQNAFLSNPTVLWQRGYVPYRIDTFEWEGVVEPIFLDDQIENITQSLGKIMRDVPCIKFKEVNATFQGSHLIFTAMGGTSCFSNVGRVGGKGQLVNLGSSQCLHQGVVIHETLHALGAVHEHTRPDRDDHVKVLLENVQPGQEHNFQKVSNDTHTTGNTPFDYQSIMIYGPFDFGIEISSGSRKRIIQPLKSGVVIGGANTKTEMSMVDRIELARAYQPLTAQTCFTVDTLLPYAEYLDSKRQSCACTLSEPLVPQVSDIELRSSGGAGEYQGKVLGVYQALPAEELDGGGRVYKQRHDGDIPYYIWRSGQFWYIGDKLRDESDVHMKAPEVLSEQPPTRGWLYHTGKTWLDDSTLELGVPSLPCRTVLVELTGEAAKMYGSWAGGRYIANSNKWQRGREVLQHESGKYLTVPTAGTTWTIHSTIDKKEGWISSNSAGSICPASPANAISKRLGRLKWTYWDGSAWIEGGVTVTCKTPGVCL